MNFSLKSKIFGSPRLKSGAYLRFLTGHKHLLLNTRSAA
ncbi:hypothetical protein AVDCRST_MAG84-5471 [uncultured Microcoleus sp.]|uniref:Uncharacterized protein n=1 Tax=uncultured Microcoleus sp. TaxID=259945 RepID=A0A6J4NIV4_9CYAN|nr:hypothetical protein AVDCRST_MAG84-5471 [uncultured Microcoleus sp.]